jgi:hypothetical protein
MTRHTTSVASTPEAKNGQTGGEEVKEKTYRGIGHYFQDQVVPATGNMIGRGRNKSVVSGSRQTASERAASTTARQRNGWGVWSSLGPWGSWQQGVDSGSSQVRGQGSVGGRAWGSRLRRAVERASERAGW